MGAAGSPHGLRSVPAVGDPRCGCTNTGGPQVPPRGLACLNAAPPPSTPSRPSPGAANSTSVLEGPTGKALVDRWGDRGRQPSPGHPGPTGPGA